MTININLLFQRNRNTAQINECLCHFCLPISDSDPLRKSLPENSQLCDNVSQNES